MYGPELDVDRSNLSHLFSERARTGETMILNMGPQHPSTHGVLRIVLELDGEEIVTCIPDIGFLHSGIEKNMEAKRFEQALVMTDRMDYLNNLGNNLAFCLALEKLVELDVPPRAQVVRVILAELQRISSHLVWLGTHANDLGAMSVLLYSFREREIILDIFEMVSGQRMMTSYFRPGGLWRDLPPEFEDTVQAFLKIFPGRIKEYEGLLTHNPLYMERTKGIGVISAQDALEQGLTGPPLRATGVPLDLRKTRPYSGYETYDFDVPVDNRGDTYARYIVRMEEMRQSARIIKQALDRLPSGPFRSNNRKFVPPPRSELGQSMEAVIHHFKLWTEGFLVPKGSVYMPVESPRGILGCFMEGNGTAKPQRVHFRTPSFANLQAMPPMSEGHLVADMVAIISSLDPVLGDVDR
ncbi:MAG: NADH dehydrogenase (quinone) subunit D [Anaerolineales bacterium]|nr:NADH dehydrogenase (quinone) subunit D [Anaerolineales bacterium]